MSILETISSLNQEATAARALTENANHKNLDKASRRLTHQNLDASSDRGLEETQDYEKLLPEYSSEAAMQAFKQEDSNDNVSPMDDNKNVVLEATQNKESQNESDEQRPKVGEKPEKKAEVSEKTDKKESRPEKRSEHSKKAEEAARQKEEKLVKEKEIEMETIKANAEKSSKPKLDMLIDGMRFCFHIELIQIIDNKRL